MRLPDRRRRETTLERRYLNFLAEVGRVLGETLPYEATLQRVCDAAVNTLADTATMYLYDENRELQLVAAAHVNRARSEHLRDRAAALLGDACGPRTFLESVIQNGSGMLVAQVDDRSVDSVAVSPEHAQYLRDGGVSSFIVVPLVAAESEVLGALGLVYTKESGLHYDDDALILAEDLGRRCGAAIAKAKTIETAVDVSTRFQYEALPKSLPQNPGLELDSFYEPASSAMLVGGDWFDAFMLSDGKLGITIGDVSGHGVKAAALMSNLRCALRIAMLMESNLANVLAAADLLVRQEFGSTMFATANIGVLDAAARTLSCVAAGHPGPLCWNDRDRAASDPFLERGLPLGFRDLAQTNGEAQTIDLRTYSFVVFFTDGLLEGERDYIGGEARLMRAIAQPAIRESVHPAKALRSAIVGRRHPDDIAVLTLRVGS